MRTHFYNAKVNGIWSEITVKTLSGRGNKPAAVKEFKKFDSTITDKDVYSAINAPENCPISFNKWLAEIETK